MTPRKQRGKIRQTNIYTNCEDQKDKYIYIIRLNNMTPRKQRGRSDGHIYILRRKMRRTHIYTIRLNNRPPLKQSGKI
jgi:hypothetical protein